MYDENPQLESLIAAGFGLLILVTSHPVYDIFFGSGDGGGYIL